jgi:GntR family transcriptional regulator
MRAREWPPGSQLPTEIDLMREYEVSRATVRQALTVLESQGLVTIRHGRGSFVSDSRVIHAGMQELRSITETIAAQGHRPGQRYRSMGWRAASSDERDALDTGEDEPVLDVQRAFLADDVVVAYGYEILPPRVLPAEFSPDELRAGPLFDFLEQRSGVLPARAVAHVHAVQSDDVGWGHDDPRPRLYILLDQVIYDMRSRPVMHSKVFFIEGRFEFVVARSR